MNLFGKSLDRDVVVVAETEVEVLQAATAGSRPKGNRAPGGPVVFNGQLLIACADGYVWIRRIRDRMRELDLREPSSMRPLVEAATMCGLSHGNANPAGIN